MQGGTARHNLKCAQLRTRGGICQRGLEQDAGSAMVAPVLAHILFLLATIAEPIFFLPLFFSKFLNHFGLEILKKTFLVLVVRAQHSISSTVYS
jgi:hypothetical protein